MSQTARAGHDQEDSAMSEAAADVEYYVKYGADVVTDGKQSIEELTAPADIDMTDADFQERVAAELESAVIVDDEPDDEGQPKSITRAGEVDWQALWAEFGFDSPDAHGNESVGRTKLREALQVSEQPIAADSQALIDSALSDGILHESTLSAGEDSGTVVAGYIFDGGAGR
jgi:hypothetical protein